MKAKIFLLTVAVGLFFSSSPVQAQPLLSLFELESGARPLAMGGAFTALAGDGHALFYNPAGLAYLRELHVSSYFESRFTRAAEGSLSLALPRMGAQLEFLTIGELVQRDELGVPGGALGYSQIGILLGGGLALDREPLALVGLPLALGLQLKVLSVSTLAPGSGTAFSLTPSLLWAEERLVLGGLPLKSLRLGLIAPNLLSLGMTYGSGHREEWGPGLRLGAAAVLAGGLALALDVEGDGTVHLGGEWRLSNVGFELEGFGALELAVRLGLSNAGSVLTPSVGFGLRLGDFQLDYAFVMHPELPGVHRLEFSAVLGPPNPLLCALSPASCPPDDPLALAGE